MQSPMQNLAESDALPPPPDETHELAVGIKDQVRAKSAAPTREQILAGYKANYAAQLKRWKAAKKQLDDWKKKGVQQAYFSKWWAEIDKKCRVEVVKDRAKLRRKHALARIHTNLARIEIGELKKQLAQAREDVFFGDFEKDRVRILEKRINNRCCDLAQREEQEARHAIQKDDPDYKKRELSIARAEHLAGLRQENIQELEEEIAKHEGNATKVRTLTKKLEAAIGPDRLEVSREKATAEARRVRGWTVETPPFVVLSPARVDLHAHLDAVVRAARAEIMRSR